LPTSDLAAAWEDAARRPQYRQAISPHGDTYDESGSDAARRLLEVVAPNPGLTLLEYGCGDGRVTQHLVKHFRRVICCDISPTMLDHLRTRGLTNVGYVCTDGTDLDETYDAAYSDFCLLHVPKDVVRQIVPRIIAGLPPGGAFAFQLPCYTEPPHHGPLGAFGVGVWSPAELLDLAGVSGCLAYHLAINFGSFSFETIGPAHQALHLFRKVAT
jgi:cyclopropane fatty-acyl-phospholipid synthase-like methyltransferase